MIRHTITRKWTGSGSTISKDEVVTGSGEQNIDQDVDASASDLLVAFAMDVSELKSIYMVASSNMVVVPHKASDDTAMTSIDLQKNVPFEWTEGSGLDNPFSNDIGALHVTNSDDALGTLQIRSLYDSTPTTNS
jgi:hypothetical protein